MYLVKTDPSSAVPLHPLHRTATKQGLRRIYRGVYAEVADEAYAKLRAETTHAMSVMAFAEMNPGAIFSGPSAAMLHGLPLLRSRISKQVHVTRSASSRQTEWSITHRAKLHDDDIMTVAGIRCTSICRTVRDLAAVLEPHELLAVADAAVALGADLTQLAEDRRSRNALRWVVAHADGRAERFGESWSRYQLLKAELPLPELQVNAFDANGKWLARGDFATADGVIGEFDGKIKYDQLLAPGETAADAVMREKERENRLRDAGFEVVRWSWSTLQKPDHFIERWRKACERATHTPPPSGTLKVAELQRPTSPDWSSRIKWKPAAELEFALA